MDLFVPIVAEEKLHKNFLSVMVPFRKAERDLLEKWADGFEDRDGKFVAEFQTTFNSSFWEIYLYAAFKEYGLKIDWSHQTPDFSIVGGDEDFIVEAVTANAADGKPNEWDKSYSAEELKNLDIKKLNVEGIIRLSNAILGKVKKYNKSYSKFQHVKNKPFVIAVAPFEQPHFNYQYDRPIRALLYDYYVDEEAYLLEPEKFPDGPPGLKLGYVEKDNGAEIPLGFFDNPDMAEVSAVLFSCTATWGKLSATSENDKTDTRVLSIWASSPKGEPEKRDCPASEHEETILDGLQVYHNPFAKNPLDPEVFRAERVVQHYFDMNIGEWVYEGFTGALQNRLVIATPKASSNSSSNTVTSAPS
ncbi:hypothetical protein ACJJI3_12505 [Microbulbifer sp. ZKSA004]|uniref:hypothetical protein n=1 Tax=Microbulbifer sp. ZKSA004 TaxID=3243389 RepID=UPI0040395958